MKCINCGTGKLEEIGVDSKYSETVSECISCGAIAFECGELWDEEITVIMN